MLGNEDRKDLIMDGENNLTKSQGFSTSALQYVGKRGLTLGRILLANHSPLLKPIVV